MHLPGVVIIGVVVVGSGVVVVTATNTAGSRCSREICFSNYLLCPHSPQCVLAYGNWNTNIEIQRWKSKLDRMITGSGQNGLDLEKFTS